MPTDPIALILMFFVVPLWLLAGLADWLCHLATNIERTTGSRESRLHILQFSEMGGPLLAALFLDINALVIAVMIGGLYVEELARGLRTENRAFWRSRAA